MGGARLKKTSQEKDVGVQVTDDLKPAAQCKMAASVVARAVISQVQRAFHYRDKNTYLKLHKLYVRPHLEFAATAWSPWTAGDRERLEKVQEKAIKAVSTKTERENVRGKTSRTWHEKLGGEKK